jgi:hypothetical protein
MVARMTKAIVLSLILFSSAHAENYEVESMYSALNGKWECEASFDLLQGVVVKNTYDLFVDGSAKKGVQKGIMNIQDEKHFDKPSLVNYEVDFSFQISTDSILFFDIKSTYLVIEKNHDFIDEDKLNNNSEEQNDRASITLSADGSNMQLAYESAEQVYCDKVY